MFTVKSGKDIGKAVSLKVSNPGGGILLRESWNKLTTKEAPGGIETRLSNDADYTSYWNYGHRIVTKKGATTKGFK